MRQSEDTGIQDQHVDRPDVANSFQHHITARRLLLTNPMIRIPEQIS